MRPKNLWSFTSLIWLLVLVLAFHALCWPLIENVWAYYHWERAPYRHVKNDAYLFLYHDRVYYGQIRDFWDRRNYPPEPRPREFWQGPPDGECYVAPNHSFVVMRLDAHKHPERALPGLIEVALASCVAFVITYASRKSAKRRTESSTT
jgi:hypothetical protein